MSTGPLFSLPISATSERDVAATSDIEGADWLAPTTAAFSDDYMTPFAATTLHNHPWTSFTKPILPETAVPPLLGTTFTNHFYLANAINRPRSSPSTFGPGPDSINWPTPGGLGISFAPEQHQPTTVPGNLFAPKGSVYNTRETPELQAPIPRKPFQIIAPSLANIPVTKRSRDDVDDQDSDASVSKRRRRATSVGAADLSEDDRYLVQLKEDDNLPWKEIATRFSTDRGKSFQVPALQMRYKRLRERFRTWEEQDVQALKLAHEYWTKYKWEIISQKMTEFGSPERWPARHCARKWQEFGLTTASSLSGVTPAMTQYTSSPTDGPLQFAFLPI